MQELQNQRQFNKVEQAPQDKDLMELAALSHDLLQNTVGKKWFKAVQNFYIIKQGTFHPGMTNADYWAAYREGQNSFIRQIELWHKEKQMADQLKARQLNEQEKGE